jgi:PAS domain S-box-containing protein
VSSLAQVLRTQRSEIVRRWLARIATMAGEAGPTPVLVDSLPQYLDALVAALEARGGPHALAAAHVAAEHGSQRSLVGVELGQVVTEYRALREVMLEVARDEGDVPFDEVLALTDLILDGAATALRAWGEEGQAALRRGAELLELGDAFYELDRDWRYVRVNANQERLSGKRRDETLGRVFWEVWPELAQPGNPYWDEYHRVMNERVAREFDAYYAPLRTWSAVTAYPVEGGGVAVFFRDVTPRKRAERQLAETVALLEGIFARVPVGLAFVDRDLRYVNMNESLAAMRGVSPSAVVGRSVREVFPALADVVEANFREVLASGQAVLDVELSTSGAEGAQGRHYVASYFPVRDAAGRIFMVGAVVTDITHRKNAEEELRRAREFEQHLIAIVSHDLRNPLGAILLSASTLLSRDDLPDRHLRSIARMRSAAERATRLIHDLLDLTRARLTGSVPIQRRSMDLGQVMDDALDELRATAGDRDITVERRGSLEGAWDPDRLAQVASNLVANALKYGRPDRPVQVELDGREPELVLLRVRNEGEPIPPELLERLFRPWERADHSGGAAEGVGLGLFIVERIVAAHGGAIRAASTPRGETTFEVRLPRGAGAAVSPAEPSTPPGG